MQANQKLSPRFTFTLSLCQSTLTQPSWQNDNYVDFYCFFSKMGGLDDVTIFDGSNSDSDLIERKSGNHRSFGISSNGHEMYLELDSGDFKYDNENGFLATFYYGKSNKQ